MILVTAHLFLIPGFDIIVDTMKSILFSINLTPSYASYVILLFFSIVCYFSRDGKNGIKCDVRSIIQKVHLSVSFSSRNVI